MMEKPTLRKPKLHFDVAVRPSHVTFDDGKEQRRNLPWHGYVESCWDYSEPDLIVVHIGEWVVLIQGHNLGPLFQAIEEQALARLRAQPELGELREGEADTFARGIRFLKQPAAGAPKRNGPAQLELDPG